MSEPVIYLFETDYLQVLSLVVKNVYHMERVPPMLYDVGKKHCVFAHRGFKPEHWDIFLVCYYCEIY